MPALVRKSRPGKVAFRRFCPRSHLDILAIDGKFIPFSDCLVQVSRSETVNRSVSSGVQEEEQREGNALFAVYRIDSDPRSFDEHELQKSTVSKRAVL
jgi:hypothetical protein